MIIYLTEILMYTSSRISQSNAEKNKKIITMDGGLISGFGPNENCYQDI